MPRLPPPKHSQFKPGQSGNPRGGALLPKEIREAKALTQTQFVVTVNKYLNMSRDQLKEAALNPASQMLDLIVIKVIEQAISRGDQIRLGFILDRLIGKVPDRVEAHVTSEVANLPEDQLIEQAEKRLAEIKARRNIP